MAKKPSSEAVATAAPAKRTPEEKAQRKADKASRSATKNLTDDRAEKKAAQKQTLKSAAKQLQKELDTRMTEVVTRIRKETKAKLKEVVKEATRRLDVDTERMFEQALHTIVRHYDSIAPGRTIDINLPAPTAPDTEASEEKTPGRDGKKNSTSTKNDAPRKARLTKPDTSATQPARKKAGHPSAKPAAPAASNGRGPGRPRRQATDLAGLSTPEGATNDSVAVDTV